MRAFLARQKSRQAGVLHCVPGQGCRSIVPRIFIAIEAAMVAAETENKEN
jgi:hypothetical protein